MYGIRKHGIRKHGIWVLCLASLYGSLVCAPEAHGDGFVPFEKQRMVRARVTAYCAGTCCCGSQARGVTSTGRDAALPGVAVAPDAIPYGHLLWIPGAGYRIADDTGGAMRTSWRVRREVHVDLRMTSHEQAKAWGVRELEIAVYRPVAAARVVADTSWVARTRPAPGAIEARAVRAGPGVEAGTLAAVQVQVEVQGQVRGARTADGSCVSPDAGSAPWESGPAEPPVAKSPAVRAPPG